MGIRLDLHDLREVFGDSDPTVHAEEARERWGETDAHAQSQARTWRFSKGDWVRVRAEGEEVERRLAEALTAGVPADSEQAPGLAQYVCDVVHANAAAG